MGYSHGRKWTDRDIKQAVQTVIDSCGLGRMPSRSEIVTYYGDSSLACAISNRKGGWYGLANEMGLPVKKSETYLGKKHESVAENMLMQMGFDVDRMPQNFPYDLLVDHCVKVDVKASHLYRGKLGNFYTFNLEKKYATCDVYILFALDDESNVVGTYIVPSKYVIQNTQISIGEINSKYHKFKDRWDYMKNMSEYLTSL